MEALLLIIYLLIEMLIPKRHSLALLLIRSLKAEVAATTTIRNS